MITPHKGEHKKGETGSESWWTLLWCLWRPPSLSKFGTFGDFLFSALEMPRDDHFEGLAAVCGPSRTETIPRTGKKTGLPRRAVQSQQHSQVTPECAHVAAGVFLADEFFLPFFSFVLV